MGWPYSLYPALWVFGGIYGAVLYPVAHPVGLWSGLWGGPIASIPPYGSLGSPMGLIGGDLIFSIPPYRFWGS